MRTLYLPLAIGLFVYASIAEEAPKTMLRMEVRLANRDVQPGSFASKPKVYFRATNRYCRTEEAPDPENKIHGLLIVNEPDAWMINLESKTGRHIVDSGPTFNCRLPIFAPLGKNDAPDSLTNDLQFGRELEFFQKLGASPQTGSVIQGKQTNVYIIEIGAAALGLLTYGSPERPLSVSRKYAGNTDIFWYDNYGEQLFDSKLFGRPEGINIEEVNPQSKAKNP